jgi:ATP-dependent Zn protease
MLGLKPQMKIAMKRRPIPTAYHEAGHVVMAIDGGLIFEYVTIIENDSALGHVSRGKTERTVDDIPVCEIPNEVAFLMGGILAEENTKDELLIGSKDDMLAIAKLVKLRITEEEVVYSEYIKRILIRTEAIIKTRWSDIEKIATALMEKKTLTYKEVAELVIKHK